MQDLLSCIQTRDKICIVVIDFAGLTTNTEDLEQFLRNNSNSVKVIVDKLPHTNSIQVFDSDELLNDHNKLQKFECTNNTLLQRPLKKFSILIIKDFIQNNFMPSDIEIKPSELGYVNPFTVMNNMCGSYHGCRGIDKAIELTRKVKMNKHSPYPYPSPSDGLLFPWPHADTCFYHVQACHDRWS